MATWLKVSKYSESSSISMWPLKEEPTCRLCRPMTCRYWKSLETKKEFEFNIQYLMGHTSEFRRQYGGSTAAGPRQYGGSTAAVRRQYCGSTAAVPRQYCGSTAAVPRQCHGSIETTLISEF